MLRFLRYIFIHPRESFRIFWKAFTGIEDLSERIANEEARMNALRLAIGFYKNTFGRFPTTLDDLCFNNHNDSNWNGSFIKWNGRATFDDTFGFPYQYCVENDHFVLSSPGLETALKYNTTTKNAAL